MNFTLRRFLYSSFFVWGMLALGSGAYLFYYGKKSLRFGIDLVGGSYIMLEVQQDDVVKNELADKLNLFEIRLADENIPLVSKPVFDKDILTFSFATADAAREAQTICAKEDNNLTYKVQDTQLIISISSSRLQHLIQEATNANTHILETRLNSIGLSEVHVSKQGDRFIVVELPDVQDPYQAKMMIGKAAVLEFKIVEESGPTKKSILDKYDGELPEGTVLVSGKNKYSNDKEWYLVPALSTVSGRYLKNATVDLGGELRAEVGVSFELDQEGGKRFYELTSKNINQPLAVILDDEVIQVAVVRSAIRNQGRISGNFKSEEATSLAKLLKSGAFKARVKFVEERQIGPTLGQESINKGVFSCLVGLAFLFLFSVIIYRVSGLFAFLALVFNLLLVVLLLSLLGATLTLPGIAGMVLTVSMAIDSSILIYEQIRDAVSRGVPVRKAVDEGFAGALHVILDANITTFIVAIVLFYFGTGPIKGFAVTMALGIVTTLVTGLLFLRSIFTVYLQTFNIQKLSI